MNTLKITFWAGEGMTITAAYHELLQGVLYACWAEQHADLHDEGFVFEGRAYRLFVFSDLQGNCRYHDRLLTFTGAVSFWVRSPAEELIEAVADHLAEAGMLRLGSWVLPLLNLQVEDRLLFGEVHQIRMLSPVTLHYSLENGKTFYPAPDTPEFAQRLSINLARRLEAAGREELLPMVALTSCGPLRKCVTRFKSTIVNAWYGDFVLQAPPEVMQFLYHTGVGDRNSQGFGMFDIVDTPCL